LKTITEGNDEKYPQPRNQRKKEKGKKNIKKRDETGTKKKTYNRTSAEAKGKIKIMFVKTQDGKDGETGQKVVCVKIEMAGKTNERSSKKRSQQSKSN